MRLINADGLIADFMKIAITRSLTHKKDRMTFTKIKETITKQPPVDARLVVHGEWIMINKQLAKCSVCGGYESTNGKDKTGKGVIFKMQKKFCPHCGADMRGENNGNHN